MIGEVERLGYARRVRRTFWPVGQGAFYTETFLDWPSPYGTVVYDCGVSGDTIPIMKCIRELEWKYGNSIDLLFISHFHADHISHIPYLLRNFQVKAIVLPVVTPDVAVEMYLNNYVETGRRNVIDMSFVERLLTNDASIDDAKVFRVDYNDDAYALGDNVVVDLSDQLSNARGVNSIKSMSTLRLYDWEYILCNYITPRSSALVTEMAKRYPELLNALRGQKWKEVRTLLKRISFDEIVKLYRESYSKDQNEESMTVLSKPIDDYYTPASCCLYTGDSPFRDLARLDFVKTCYYRDWWRIGTIQASHHGADKDNPQELYDKRRTCVACYGTGNSYGHPGREALMNMAVSRSNIRLVNEGFESIFCQHIGY